MKYLIILNLLVMSGSAFADENSNILSTFKTDICAKIPDQNEYAKAKEICLKAKSFPDLKNDLKARQKTCYKEHGSDYAHPFDPANVNMAFACDPPYNYVLDTSDAYFAGAKSTACKDAGKPAKSGAKANR